MSRFLEKDRLLQVESSSGKLHSRAGQRRGVYLVCSILLYFLLTLACTSSGAPSGRATLTLPPPPPTGSPVPTQTAAPVPSPFPTRPLFDPGELVDYTAQTGDTIPALAARFNTGVAEIMAANPFIPENNTTMPPGMPMQIPVYYRPFWGSPFRIIPDSDFVNGPTMIGFDTGAFVASQPGWLLNHVQFVGGQTRNGAGLVNYVAQNYSVSPKLLLALLEFQTGALSQPIPPAGLDRYPLGQIDRNRQGLYLQLVLAANKLNNGYYGWRSGDLLEFELLDGRIERPDPWQNAATVAIQHYLSELLPPDQYAAAVSENGIAAVYERLFGDPWESQETHIPGSLRQPEFILPFELGIPWTYTGGPHTGFGSGAPLAALDFAPPAKGAGCLPSNHWVTAVAAGVVVRHDTGILVLDLDGDGDERTGWNVLYLHIERRDKAPLGSGVEKGDRLGHPSCEGGTSTGTHIHLARKYNGEWIPAEGSLAFDMEGWIAYNGSQPYQGTLKRFSQIVIACTCSNKASQIARDQ